MLDRRTEEHRSADFVIHTITLQKGDIDKIVEEAVFKTLQGIGFTVDDPNAIQADMIHLRKSRIGNEEIAKWLKRSILSVFVSGMLYALWAGIKIYATGKA